MAGKGELGLIINFDCLQQGNEILEKTINFSHRDEQYLTNDLVRPSSIVTKALNSIANVIVPLQSYMHVNFDHL